MIKYLKEGRYFYQVNDNKIEEVEIKNASYIDGEVYYNDSEKYDLSRVLVKSDKGFEPITELHTIRAVNIYIKGQLYSLEKSFNLFINDDGNVEEFMFVVHQYDLTNRKLISLYYITDDDKRVEVSEDKVFSTYNLAKESRDFEVVNLDGTREITEGLLSMIRLSDEQRKMVATFKGLLKDMQGMGIQIVRDGTLNKTRFFNSRGISAYSGYLYDIPENGCHIPLEMLESVDGAFMNVTEDAEDALVVERV